MSACAEVDRAHSNDRHLIGTIGKMRMASRKFCHHRGGGESLVNLIPDDAFGVASVLKGGLYVIFSAMERTELAEKEICKALEVLFCILEDHLDDPVPSSDDEKLHRGTGLMHAAIFELFQHILT